MDIVSLIIWFTIVVCLIGLVFAYCHYRCVAEASDAKCTSETLGKVIISGVQQLDNKDYQKLIHAGDLIQSSAMTYLLEEYSILGGYVLGFGLLVYLLAEKSYLCFWVTGAYFFGAFTSMVTEYLSLRCAVMANIRTLRKTQVDMAQGFRTALSAGLGIGFGTVSLGVLSLTLVAGSYISSYITPESTLADYSDICLYLAGYALGASVVGLFARVGGGIFSKAADAGVDLTKESISEENPGQMADYVGDNIGDVIGTTAELFASLSEAICATMILTAAIPELVASNGAIYLPVFILASGLLFSMISVAIHARETKITSSKHIRRILRKQPLFAALWASPVLFFICQFCLPEEITLPGDEYTTTRGKIFVATLMGLWGGYFVGISSEIFTTHDSSQLDDLARSCHTGSATEIIYGLALGYMSGILPVVILIVVIYVSYLFASMYGIAMAACGMVSTLAVLLSVTTYTSVSDNSASLAKMCNIADVMMRTEDIHTAGRPINAHVKCFEIGAASILALAIFGAFVTRLGLHTIDLLQPIEFAGLIIGAMLPYVFSAKVLQAVSHSAGLLKKEIERQKASSGKPDYRKCIKVCTSASMSDMILPCSIVIFTPLTIGIFFGPVSMCGLLAGTIVAGVQIATAAINAGTAWNNANKYIEEGQLVLDSNFKFEEKAEIKTDMKEDKCLKVRITTDILTGKGCEEDKAALVGAEVGDPMKSVSGPAVSTLMKQGCLIALIFGQFFASVDLFGF